MKEDLYLQLIANPLVQVLLKPAACLYGMGSYLRVRAYADGFVSRVKPSAPVISIGNLTVGGTGKTPVTIEVAERLAAEGWRVAILSRGYKRSSRQPYTIVSDGNKIISSCLEAGDEPYMMAEAVPSAIVISGKARSVTSKVATDECHCDVIILDDGFQHLKLRRDFDVVLIDFNVDLENQNLLPAGLLREPLGALGRATHIIISKVPAEFDHFKMERIHRMVEKHSPKAQISMCSFKPAYLKQSHGAPVSLKTLQGKRVIAMCGIAKPEPFVASLSQLGATPIETQFFPDHHWFSPTDLAGLDRALTTSGADYIVTTEKDMVRLSLPPHLEEKVLALVMETEWIGEPPRFSLSQNSKALEVANRA